MPAGDKNRERACASAMQKRDRDMLDVRNALADPVGKNMNHSGDGRLIYNPTLSDPSPPSSHAGLFPFVASVTFLKILSTCVEVKEEFGSVF